MDFNFKEEQLQFADALQRWIARDYGFEARKQIIASDSGVSPKAWATLAELGMLALPVPEQHGGFSGSAVDLYVVMREIGRGLVIEPYFATVLATRALTLGGSHARLLEQVAGGELTMACAFTERHSRHDLSAIATTLSASGDGYLLNGAKAVVLHGAHAGSIVVSARTGAGQGTDGITLLVLDAASAGVTITGYRTLDGQRAANIVFDNVAVGRDALIGAPGEGHAILDAVADYGAALLCAEGVGAMEALFAATLEYLKTRTQFGAPIGKFQALQHRMADMYIHLEQARSMALLAAVRVDDAPGAEGDAERLAERRRCVSAAKYRIGQAARFVGQQAVQLHGGMGVTDELPASHFFKRLTMIELALGDADHHLRRFISQPGFAGTEAA